jgi:hypothetical protein
VRAAAGFVPQIRTFGDKYDKVLGLTYNGREQDRWLLAELEREAWHAEAKALQAALTDEVLERAARRMPAEWYPLDGPRLVAALKKRREALLKEADAFYRHLVEEVDVQATDAAELARVEQLPDGTAWDRRPYTAPPGPSTAPWIPPRDWGRDNFFVPWASYSSDYGVFVGGGVSTVGYSFRKHPWANQQTIRAGWAIGAKQPRVDYRGEFRRVDSGVTLGLRAYWSGLEVLRYYGFGNETTAEQDDDFYKVRQRQLVFAPSLTWPLAGSVDLTVAPAIQWATTEDDEDLVTQDKPYGSGTFGQVGAWTRLRLDTRRAMSRAAGAKGSLPSLFGAAGYPVSGVYVEAIGSVFPKAWDVESTYGWVEGQAAGFLSAGSQGRATLAARVGSKHMFGTYPFHNAAVVGGGGFFSGLDAVRGLRPNRFIGDTSLYGNAELRLYISRFVVALPGEWGLFGFGDVGRVWLEGETSDTWHSSWGGGLWIGLLSRANSVAFTVAQSDERTAFYVRAGFSF